jgi:tetratricopeptide (TPR) repeat protein
MDQLAGHPLAMGVVLPKLEGMSAAEIAAALRTNIAELGLDEQEEQGRLFATLRFVEQGLAEELRPLLGLVGLHEGYVDADYLEEMAKQVNADWTRQRIDRLMGALGVAGLLRDVGQATYEMHPLLTSYLRPKSDANERCQRAFVDVVARLADGLTARQLHEQRGPLLLHGANLHFALALGEQFSMEPAFPALTQCLAQYALNSRNFEESSRLFARLAAHSAARDESDGEAGAYHQLGMIAERQRNFATAREWYLKSLAIEEKRGNLNGSAISYHQLGVIAQGQRNFPTAQEWYLKSLAIKEKQGNLPGAAKTYHQLGMAAEEQRDFAAAREWYLKSLAIKEKQNDPHGAAITYNQLGIVAEEQRDFAAARVWYFKSLAIKEAQGDLDGAAVTYHGLGVVAQYQRDFAAAREWYLKSLAIKEKLRNVHGAASTYHQLGTLAGMQGGFEESGRWLVRSVAALLQTHDQQSANKAIGSFLILYRQASPADKQRLEAIWRDANLGPLPTEPNE